MKISTIVLMLLSVVSFSSTAISLDKLNIPDGFSVEVHVDNVPNARQMALGANGNLYVGTRNEGKVYAVIDSNGDKKLDQTVVIAEGLNMPSGIAYRDGALYVAEVQRIIRFSDVDNNAKPGMAYDVVFDELPNKGHHGWKNIDFGPDGMLYVPVGAPCNVCDEALPFMSIMKVDIATRKFEYVAKGVRNSVGFDWHPTTNELWFSDNGRDMMGDNLPPCEINHVSEEGQHFGFPYFHAGIIPDPDFSKGKKSQDYRHPAYSMGAHVAPLGIRFYQGEMFPKDFKGKLFIAEHGSWNRAEKVGYKISMLTLSGDKVINYETFIDGWLEGQQAWGRPVAMLTLNDGSLLISDDYAGVVYRVSYNK